MLGSQGDDVQGKDVWLYLFQADSQKQPGVNLEKFADNFGEVIENIRADDLLENENSGRISIISLATLKRIIPEVH